MRNFPSAMMAERMGLMPAAEFSIMRLGRRDRRAETVGRVGVDVVMRLWFIMVGDRDVALLGLELLILFGSQMSRC